MTSRPVVVVGDAGLDVVARTPSTLVRGGDVPATVRWSAGGSAANTAAWLADSGMPVALVSRVGTDLAGQRVRADLESAGVVCRFVPDATRPTCTVVVILDGSGPDVERTMVADRGASAALCAQDLDLTGAVDALDVEGVPHVHVSGYVLLDERTRSAGLSALQEATAAGWTTSVDPAAANQVQAVGPDHFLDWVRGVDLLLPNDSEAKALGGDEAMLEAVDAVAVSMGAGGARWVNRSHAYRVPAPALVEGDPTGCGDAFDAGVLTAWLGGLGPERALARGVALGARCAGVAGGRPVQST